MSIGGAELGSSGDRTLPSTALGADCQAGRQWIPSLSFLVRPDNGSTQDLSILELTLQHSALASRKPLLGADELHVSRFIAPVVSNIN